LDWTVLKASAGITHAAAGLVFEVFDAPGFS